MVKIKKRLMAVFLLLTIFFTYIPIQVFATDTPKVLDEEYIYFDLYYGDITLSGTTYKGYVLEDGVATEKTGTIDRKIYVYQSNGENTVWENGLPKYDRVGAPEDSGKDSWGDYITNNSSAITEIITNWVTEAEAVNRTATPYRIAITGANDYDVTIDNIWSKYHLANSSRITGGLSFYPKTSTASSAKITLKGDNRFGNIFYATDNYTNHEMIFDSIDDATLTVANISTSGSANHYNAAIGGSDSAGGNSVGLIFEDGIIYAGTTYADNCTAIGAGGNAKGVITINGGTITAVANSTGVAIGGGIGYSQGGGDANIEIAGGTIYAYNFGYEGIPAAAIGGGSSRNSNGNSSTTVTITGGNVYAESVAGTAIGGGSSKTRNGGPATINIGGDAKVTAKSVAGKYNGTTLNAGAAIGGGTGGTTAGAYGGNATVNIYGDAEIYTGSIGGGKTNNSTGKIGNATVVISENPTIQGQIIMAAGSNNPCSFTMTGGTIDNSQKTDDFVFLQENGGAVYVEYGNATMNGGRITGCTTATDGGAIYVVGGDFTMTSGTITNNEASNEAGAIYVSEGDVIIGDEDCVGTDLAHSHPIISDNVAINNGGAITINGGQLSMYCGKLVDNSSIKNQASNSVHQSGGIFNIEGGDLGLGILVTGGTFNDYRGENVYQVRLHAKYDDIDEVYTLHVKNNEQLILPRENDIDDISFTREGLYLTGWSTNEESSEGYILVGNKISIPQDTDLYAVWGSEEPIASFVVTIPDEIELDETGYGSMRIGATIKFFTNDAELNIIISEFDKLYLDGAADEWLAYDVIDSEENILLNGDIAATFTTENLKTKKLIIETSEEPKYSGTYSGTLTFVCEYDSGL